jgi:hypothetical protein
MKRFFLGNDQAFLVSRQLHMDAGRAVIAIAVPVGDSDSRIESREFDVPSGANLKASVLGEAVGTLRALALGPGGSVAALCEAVEKGTPYWQIYRGGAALGWAGKRVVVETRANSPSRETGLFIDSHGNTYLALAFDSEVYGGRADRAVPRVASSVSWPERGVKLAPMEEFAEGVKVGYVAIDVGLVFRLIH